MDAIEVLPGVYYTDEEKILQKYDWLKPITIKKGDDWVTQDCKINPRKLRELLEKWGFFRHYIDKKSRVLLRVQDGRVEIWDDEQLRDFFDKEMIREMPEELPNGITRDMVENKFLSSQENMLKTVLINQLKHTDGDVQFMEHERSKAYFYYKNGFVEVTPMGYKLKHYREATKLIFKDNILNREFKHMPSYEFEKYPWFKFLQNISNEKDSREDRLSGMMTVIGYLLHQYFAGKLKAILLLDSRGSSDSPKGRGGKSLLGKGIGHMVNANMRTDRTYLEIDGKTFDQTASTKYQMAELNTRIIHINDIEHRGKTAFKNTLMFNEILEGITVKQMYAKPFSIPVKFLLSSNHTFRTDNDSTRDRFVEVQLTGYYSSTFSPDKEFKQWFFSEDWKEKDWNAFDNFMLTCVQRYLQNGLCPPKGINLDQLKAIHNSSENFIEFMEALRLEVPSRIKNGVGLNKKELKEDFLRLFPEEEFLLKNDKVWNRYLRAYTYYHPFFEPYTDETKSKFDTTEHVNVTPHNSVQVRVFKYWFKEEK